MASVLGIYGSAKLVRSDWKTKPQPKYTQERKAVAEVSAKSWVLQAQS